MKNQNSRSKKKNAEFFDKIQQVFHELETLTLFIPFCNCFMAIDNIASDPENEQQMKDIRNMFCKVYIYL